MTQAKGGGEYFFNTTTNTINNPGQRAPRGEKIISIRPPTPSTTQCNERQGGERLFRYDHREQDSTDTSRGENYYYSTIGDNISRPHHRDTTTIQAPHHDKQSKLVSIYYLSHFCFPVNSFTNHCQLSYQQTAARVPSSIIFVLLEDLLSVLV